MQPKTKQIDYFTIMAHSQVLYIVHSFSHSCTVVFNVVERLKKKKKHFVPVMKLITAALNEAAYHVAEE